MEIIKINLGSPELEVIVKAKSILSRGGCLVYPTDTVYGLGANALREDSVERIFRMKKRPSNRPIPIMVRDIEMAKQVAFIDRKTERTLAKVWPGPVTVVLERRGIIPNILAANQRTIGLRIPDCLFTQTLMNQLDFPVTSTSANFSGQASSSSAEEVINVFQNKYPRPDLILDAGLLPRSSPSTVLDLTGFQPKILRLGPVTKEELSKIFK